MFDKCLHPISVNGNLYACGKCRYCRAKRQLTWTLRGKHEGLKNKGKIFITLTYQDENLPKNSKTQPENEYDRCGTLKKRDFQLFMKRLRKAIKKPLKYIAAGEYSPERWRPHYHAIIFGISNKEIGKLQLEKIWGKGFVDIDDKPIVTPDAIAYVVGYINKKMQDNHSWEHYEGNAREEPFQLQSQKIGINWSENHKWSDRMTIGFDDKEVSIPRYYINKIYEKEGKKIRLDNTIILARDINKCQFITNSDNLFNGEWKIKGRDIHYIEKKSKYYKTFINPEGEESKKILEKLLENKLENADKMSRKYKLSAEQTTKIKAKIAAENQIYINKIKSEWEDVQNLTQEELKLKYEHTTVRFTNRWITTQFSELIPTGFNTNQYLQAIENARLKNQNIEENLRRYEKRKQLDQEEDIKEFTKSFSQSRVN